jgi:ribulose-phosphate 3-epimerase
MISIGVQRICFHQESAFHIDRVIDIIKDAGIQAGVALSPATSVMTLEYVAEKLDFILLMLINPGFAGYREQKQVSYGVRKVAACRKFLDDWNLDASIEVDGRVSFETIPAIVAAGGEILVAGSSCLFCKSGGLAENFERMKAGIDCGLAMRKKKKR